MTFQSQPLHLLVKRNPWEPKHEWESRLLFVKDNLEKYGLEKAIHLSLVWANTNFLGCSYPSHTQELVSEYPQPDQDSLRSERKKREQSERKVRESGGGGSGEREGTKRVKVNQDETEDTSSKEGLCGNHDSSAEETDASFEQVSLQVDALISAIRRQHEKKAEEKMKQGDANIPQEVLKMLRSMCMCNQCFTPGTSPSSLVNSYFQRYLARFDKKFKYNFSFNEGSTTTECKFTINGQIIAETRGENKKFAKQRSAEHFLKLVNSYYQQQGKPCCPYEPQRKSK